MALLIPGVGLVDASGTLLIPGAGIVEQAAAVTTVNAALAATESADVAAFAVSVKVAAALAATESSDTAALAATVLVEADLTATESPDTADFALLLDRWLDLAATEASDTAAFAVITGSAPEVTEQPSGGWGAYNAMEAEKARRKRKLLEDLELEAEEERERVELANRLEAQLVAEGTLKAVDADLLRLRGLAATYDGDLPNRTQRALAYAERAKTEAAIQLALREVAKVQEDEELALLLLLVAA